MFRKIFLAVALIVASGGTAIAASVAGAGSAGAVSTPAPTTITCAETGTVTFPHPGLSTNGSLTSATTVKTKSLITGTGAGCSGLPTKIVIPSSTTQCPNNPPLNTDPVICQGFKVKKGVTVYNIDKKPYYYDTDSSYASTGINDLIAELQAKPPKVVIDNMKLTLAYGSAAQVLPGNQCGATDAGFALSGNVIYGKTTVITTYSETVCIIDDTGTGITHNFVTDLGNGATIASAIIGGADSVLTINLPNAGCALNGTVAFPKPGLSNGGALSKNTVVKTKATPVPTGTNCSGEVMKAIIPSATTACPNNPPLNTDPPACQEFKVKHGVTVYEETIKPYYMDTITDYATNGLADLQAALQAKPLKTVVNGIKVTLAYGTASIVSGGNCGAGGVGFEITGQGQIKGLPVGDYLGDICLTGDTGTHVTNNFLTDVSNTDTDVSTQPVIATAVIGGSSALTFTFGTY